MRRSLLALSLAFPAVAGAQDLPADAENRFQAGVALAERGECGLALVEFEAARAIQEAAKVVYNLAYCLKTLGRFAEALRAYERVVELGLESLPPNGRPHVERSLVELRGRVAELTVTTNVPGAEVLVDGEPVTRLPWAIDLHATTHVEARATGRVPARASTRPTRPGPVEVTLSLADEPPPPPPERCTEATPRHAAPPRRLALSDGNEPRQGSMLPWVLGGAAVLAIAGGVAAVLLAGQERELLAGDARVSAP